MEELMEHGILWFIKGTYPISFIVIILVTFGWLMAYIPLVPIARKLERLIEKRE